MYQRGPVSACSSIEYRLSCIRRETIGTCRRESCLSYFPSSNHEVSGSPSLSPRLPGDAVDCFGSCSRILHPPLHPSHFFSRGPRARHTKTAALRKAMFEMPLALQPPTAYKRFPTAVPVSCPVNPASIQHVLTRFLALGLMSLIAVRFAILHPWLPRSIAIASMTGPATLNVPMNVPIATPVSEMPIPIRQEYSGCILSITRRLYTGPQQMIAMPIKAKRPMINEL